LTLNPTSAKRVESESLNPPSFQKRVPLTQGVVSKFIMVPRDCLRD